jgi:hypothetical protein
MLVFIHTPKCAGTYAATILEHLNIINKGHNKYCAQYNEITFTIIRNPIDRFESLLNFRLSIPQSPLPTNNIQYSKTPNIFKYSTLNEIVEKMADEEILGFTPYKTLKFWTENVDIIITIDELPRMLAFFGYTYSKKFQKQNVSNKSRGTFDKNTKNRLEMLFEEDIILYNNIKSRPLISRISHFI